MQPKASNAIAAAIERLGGRGRGTKRIGEILKLTTSRVYQLREDGVVQKPAQAVLLELATGIPYRAFLSPGPWSDPPADYLPGELTEEHARILAEETGIPLDVFAVRTPAASARRAMAGRVQARPARFSTPFPAQGRGGARSTPSSSRRAGARVLRLVGTQRA